MLGGRGALISLVSVSGLSGLCTVQSACTAGSVVLILTYSEGLLKETDISRSGGTQLETCSTAIVEAVILARILSN